MSNSIHYWKTKAECYGNIVHGCKPALEAAGYPVDDEQAGGAVKGIRDAVMAIAADNATLTAEVARLRGLLQRVEWEGDSFLDLEGNICKCCPECGSRKPNHDDTCEFAAALADTEQEEGGE